MFQILFLISCVFFCPYLIFSGAKELAELICDKADKELHELNQDNHSK